MAEKIAIMLRRGLVSSNIAVGIPRAFPPKLGESTFVAMLSYRDWQVPEIISRTMLETEGRQVKPC